MTVMPGLSPPPRSDVFFPEKYLVARIAREETLIDVHNAHVPHGSSRRRHLRMMKVEAFEAMRRRLDQPTKAARVLCGDLNTPWSEDDDGVQTAAHRHPESDPNRWHQAELGLLEHPELRDVYRWHHKPGTDFAVSHRTGRGRRTNHRYDHVMVSGELDVNRCHCEYLEPLLESGLSDHAPVLAHLQLR